MADIPIAVSFIVECPGTPTRTLDYRNSAGSFASAQIGSISAIRPYASQCDYYSRQLTSPLLPRHFGHNLPKHWIGDYFARSWKEASSLGLTKLLSHRACPSSTKL